MTKNERLKEARLKSGKSQDELATILGVSQAYIGGLERDQAFSLKKAKAIGNALGVSGEWLYFGDENDDITLINLNYTSKPDHDDLKKNKLDKINSLRGVIKNVEAKRKIQDNENNLSPIDRYADIPMYQFPGSASMVQMYDDEREFQQPVGQMRIPGAVVGSFALPVYGHSMYPTLENGNWCILRPISDPTDIDYGEVYYIEYGDYRVYKRLLKADEDDESVVLWSDNQTEIVNGRPKYAAKKIRVERIRKLCILTEILKKPSY